MKVGENYNNMCDFKYCRACLDTRVKMHSFCARISSGSIGETFSKVLDISVKIFEDYICTECASLLLKYEKFRLKCYRAQSILSAVQKKDAKEIYKHVKSIDRKLNGLASNLFTSQTKNHDNQAPIITDSESQCEAQVDVDVVKNEVVESEIFNDINFDDGLIDETPNFPPLEYKPDLHVKITNRKRKDHVKSTSKSVKYKHTIGCESSDDEPLSYKVTKNTEFRDTDIAVSKKFDIPELKTVLSTKESPKMSKQRNDFNDFEDYAAVIVLTPEDARKEVLLRKKSSNYINSPLKCDLCYRGYEAKAAFENHMKKHSIEYGVYQCDICHLRFPEQRYLCKHRLASHKRKFCCKICPYICFCMHQAKTHVSLHKGKKYPCKECAEVFSMPNSLLMHKRQKHSTECVCELCGHTFATPRGLHSHHMKLHRHHTNEKLGPECADCNKHFATEAAWKLHLVLSSKHNVSNGCKFCGECFSSSQDLKAHLRVHARRHAARHCGTLPGPCSMCEKWLEDRSEYRFHTSSAHPQSEAARKMDAELMTPFVCEVCGKMFKKQCFLTYHQRKHSGERPYQCGECHKTFQLAGALSTHRAVHLNARAHACSICARVFTFKSVLNKHMKVHLGIRPHRCDICDKSFISPCDVKVHIKYVHNKVPWPKRDRTKRTEPSFIQ